MLRLDFASRGFTFARIALRLRELRFYQPAAQRDFGELNFTSQRGGAVFKLRLYKPTARHNFTNYGFCRLRTTSRGFAFARRVLILSHDAILRAVLRRIADYFPHRLCADMPVSRPYGFTINSVAPAKHITL